MSMFTITGFFGLTSGRRVRTEVTRNDGTSQALYHVHYLSAVNCSQTQSIPTEIRKYSPPGDVVVQDDTIAFIIAKMYVPPGTVAGNVLLEAVQLVPVPGNPNSDTYEDSVPDYRYPAVYAHGVVSGEHDGDPRSSVIFPLTVCDYVRGQVKQSTINLRMDKTSPKWRNVPPPCRNTVITILGTCFQTSKNGNLCVDLDSISLPSTSASVGNFPVPVKQMTEGNRRKFSARAPPRAVISEKGSREKENVNRSVDKSSRSTTVKEGEDGKHDSDVRNMESSSKSEDAKGATFVAVKPDAVPKEVTTDDENSNVNEAGPSTRAKGKRKAPN